MHKFNIYPFSEFNICEVFVNDKLIAVNTLSGRGIFITDFNEQGYILGRSSSSIDIGSAILVCLKHHRKVNRKEDAELYNSNKLTSLHQKWVHNLISFGKFKNETSVFKPLYRITFIEQAGFIKAEPSYQVAVKAWSGQGITDDQICYCKSNPKEIGKIFELVLSNCKSKY